jgi:hypothetical protein
MRILFVLLGVLIFGVTFLVLLNAQSDATYTRAAVYRYQELRMASEKGDISQAATSLKDALVFWPPKIEHESRAAGVVAAFRDSTVREIITRMRLLSGENLGDDPDSWLKKYYKEEETQPNPQGGANGRQPASSETNSTSAEAASRRSP